MERFDEADDTGREIRLFLKESLLFAAGRWELHYKDPVQDIVMRLLNEIVEFKPMEEVRRSSLRPWDKG